MLENFRTQKIIWDRANKKIFEKIEANSGDSNGRKLVVQVINQEVTEGLSGTTLSLGWKSRQGAKGLDAFNVVDASKGIFEIYYTTEMLSNIGNLEASLILIDSTGRIESSTFTISVRQSTVDDESVESENSFTALTEALVKVNDFDVRLAQKTDKGNVSVNDINKNLGKFDQTFMTDEFLQQIAGETPVNATVPDNSLTTNKYVDGSVTLEKMNLDNNLVSKLVFEIGSISQINGENTPMNWRLRSKEAIQVKKGMKVTITEEVYDYFSFMVAMYNLENPNEFLSLTEREKEYHFEEDCYVKLVLFIDEDTDEYYIERFKDSVGDILNISSPFITEGTAIDKRIINKDNLTVDLQREILQKNKKPELKAYQFAGNLITKRKGPIEVKKVDEIPISNLYNDIVGDGINAERIVNIDSSQIYQNFLGAGAALTESAAWLISNKLNAKQRHLLLEELFSPEEAGWSAIRICMGASDFNWYEENSDWPFWTYNDVPNDYEMEHFSIGEGTPSSPNATKDLRWVVPVLQEILTINPNVKIIAAPWSPPAWMKDSNSLVGGSFVYTDENATALTEYFRRFIQSYKDYGIPIYGVSVQNEPQTQQPYPSCYWKGSDLGNFIKNYLSPMLYKEHTGVKIIGHDHNYINEIPNHIEDGLANGNANYIDAMGYHFYNGTVEHAHDVFKQHRHLDHWMTEMRNMINEPVASKAKTMLGRILSSGIQHGTSFITLWNLALDENGKPATAKTGRSGVITINSETGAVTRNMEYYMLRAIAQNVRAGAKRIYSTTYNPLGDSADIGSAAFINTNGDISAVLTNTSISDITTYVRLDGNNYEIIVPPYGYIRLDYGKEINPTLPMADGVLPDLSSVPRKTHAKSKGKNEIRMKHFVKDGESLIALVSRNNYKPAFAHAGIDGSMSMTKIDSVMTGNSTQRTSEAFVLKNAEEGEHEFVLTLPRRVLVDESPEVIITLISIKANVVGSRKFTNDVDRSSFSIDNSGMEDNLVLSVFTAKNYNGNNFKISTNMNEVSFDYSASLRRIVTTQKGDSPTSIAVSGPQLASLLNIYLTAK